MLAMESQSAEKGSVVLNEQTSNTSTLEMIVNAAMLEFVNNQKQQGIT